MPSAFRDPAAFFAPISRGALFSREPARFISLGIPAFSQPLVRSGGLDFIPSSFQVICAGWDWEKLYNAWTGINFYLILFIEPQFLYSITSVINGSSRAMPVMHVCSNSSARVGYAFDLLPVPTVCFGDMRFSKYSSNI